MRLKIPRPSAVALKFRYNRAKILRRKNANKFARSNAGAGQ